MAFEISLADMGGFDEYLKGGRCLSNGNDVSLVYWLELVVVVVVYAVESSTDGSSLLRPVVTLVMCGDVARDAEVLCRIPNCVYYRLDRSRTVESAVVLE